MAVKCLTYGGALGWFLRKYFSRYTSKAYLEFQYFIRKELFKKYIKYFNDNSDITKVPFPCLISIETINRCNGTCSFCPANRFSESRPFQKMSEELFKKIIAELSQKNYDGYLNLYVNNEPFMDTRIEDWYKYAKEQLPKAKMLLYTNGTLLTKERFISIVPYIDKMIINNYSEKLEMHDNIKEIYRYLTQNTELHKKDITIQIRYSKEILTNRAGFAPNKQESKVEHKICIMPFTDFTIYPNGTVGLCCSDVLEKTNYGNVKHQSIEEIWNSKTYKLLRANIGKDRSLYPFCKICDFVDAGIRNNFIANKLKGK